MLQTVLIIIHLILIAIVWALAGNLCKYESPIEYEKNKEKIIINPKAMLLIFIGICLNLGIIYWLVANIKPTWYGNYIWFILLVPISISIALFAFAKKAEKYKLFIDSISSIVFCLVILIIVAIIMFIPSHNMTLGKPEETTTKIDIVNVNDSNEVTGSISGEGFLVYLTNGSISKDKLCCYYYYQQKDGGFKLANIPADKITVYYLKEGETESYINKITTTTYFFNNRNYPAVKTDKIFDQTERYEIHVPEGSIGTYYEFNGNK